MKKAGLGITLWPRKKKDQATAQAESFWLLADREAFTKQAKEHFHLADPEKMAGVTMQAAKKHGLL